MERCVGYEVIYEKVWKERLSVMKLALWKSLDPKNNICKINNKTDHTW